MKKSHGPVIQIVFAGAKAGVVASLCITMAAPQAWAAASPVEGTGAGVPTTSRPAALNGQQKVLHALNRLTFGPRPGDEQAVTKMGLDAWFQRQLHPESIDDAGLEQRLDKYPALKLSQAELVRKFPSGQMVRQFARQGGRLPSDPVEHAIYADAIAAYDAQQKKAGAGQAVGAQGENMMPPADMQDGAQVGGVAAADGEQAMSPAAKGKGKSKKRPDVEPMSEDDVQAVLALPPDQRMAKLIAMQPDEMLSFRAGLRPFQRIMLARGLSPEQTEVLGAMQAPTRVVGSEALASRLLRNVYSERQLQAVMTDFWLNHFSVYVRKNGNEPYLLASYERDTVLPNALGKFEDLLVATAKSPAMLMYLDNWQSIGPDSPAAQRVKRFGKFAPNGQGANLPKGLNENYARELMELHTLGVNGGYTQKDVIEVAKCFTGWTIDRPYQGGEFQFVANRHEGGSKTVLGKVLQEGGENEGLEVLHMLATSPATAHFISNKLAVRFVSDAPPAALVDRMAATFLKTGGDMKAVLTTMFRSPEFWAPQVYRAKLKTPIEFMASALRASNADVVNPLPLVQAMQQLGMPIYGMQTPNGYAWTADQWANSNALVSRMNFAVVLSGGRVPGTRTDWQRLLGDGAGQPMPATERKLELLVLGQPAAVRTRETVLQEASDPGVQQAAVEKFALRPGDDEGDNMMTANVAAKRARVRNVGLMQADRPGTPVDTMAGLLLGSPEFQRR